MSCQRSAVRKHGDGCVWPRVMVVSALMLGACAQTKPSTHPSYSGTYQAQMQVAVASPPKIEIEVDGIPAQQPPVRRRGRGPDDPREPFSPNYGPPPRDGGAPMSPPPRQAALSNRDAEAIIMQAIVAQELRRQ